MSEFVGVLKEAKKWREISLVTQSPFRSGELAQGYYYQQWASDNRNLVQRQFIKALRNRAPFTEVLPQNLPPGEVEYECVGERVEGIGAAHMMDSLAVSLPVSLAWSGAWLDVTVRRLVETEVGDLAMEEVTEAVRHSARRADLDTHEKWGCSAGLEAIDSPQQLWEQREDFFPHLQFLPRVHDDLRTLDLKWFAPVRSLLARLEASAAIWNTEDELAPQWKGAKVTPEAQQRKRLCDFTDLDGKVRCFDLHGRFTPGPGRLHFRLVREEGALRVAYIGRKRGD
ncbi:hypothetical protein MBT42_08200 [Streptomyces sp. MBT42]|uniref:hypothetical protein n=1 Tax=Streptomyces sp. MBT42 TaxID=1488373 RepID=UPI001E3CC556|nr:hypothetical protein [Streptomyces sp. MBT42]MCD2463538.1 hypothetical protein [Streptomyces sp. MBT42]